MFTNRNKLSALALGALLSISALQPALAVDSTDGSPAPVFQDRPTSDYQGASMTVPQRADINASNWLEQQLQVTDGSPTPAFQSFPASAYEGTAMTIHQNAGPEANKQVERQLRITDGNPDGE